MRRLRIRHLLVSFHVSVRCTICMEHRVGQLAANSLTTDLLTAKLLPANLLSVDLLSADLLPKIHWLVGQSLILEPSVAEPPKCLGPPTPVIVPRTSDSDVGDPPTLEVR